MAGWAVLLYGLGISGGANVIFEHALYAVKQGIDVTFISREKDPQNSASWHRGAAFFNYMTAKQAADVYFDVAIATEWRSAYDVCQIKADKYIYFVQSIESRFYPNPENMFSFIAEKSYELDFSYVTEAGWIRDYLFSLYGQNAKVVKNGIDKDVFNPFGDVTQKRKGNGVRFLVEGSVNNWFKNVPKTVDLCKEAGVEELWLVTPDDIDFYPGVDRVFSRVPIHKMAQIYRSCDCLVKLSLVEGMFGPPLEMFHCGGTAIVYNINGIEEYIENGSNSIVIPVNKEDEVIYSIKRLMSDKKLLDRLKMGAALTAGHWIDWNTSSELFYRTICDSENHIKHDRYEKLMVKSRQGAYAYRQIEKMFGGVPANDRTEKVVAFLNDNNKKLAIYGAGDYCRFYLSSFSDRNIVVDGIVVSRTEGNPKSVMGHKVFRIDDISDRPEEYLIYISTEKHYDAIFRSLREHGFKDII